VWAERIALLLAVLLLGSACAPGGPAANQTTAPVPAAPKLLTMGVVAGEEPKDGGLPYGANGSNAVGPIFHASLTVYDERGNLQPRLAERVPTVESGDWKVHPDGSMEVTWKVRPGARWHDGAPFTVEDLLLGYKAGVDPEIFGRGTAVTNLIDQLVAPDPQTIVMRWKSTYIYANNMSLDNLVPLPAHLLGSAFEAGNKTAFTSHPIIYEQWVGLGPYKVKEWARGSFITGTAFDDFAAGRPKIDQVTVTFVGDTNTLLVRTVSGDVQVVPVGSLKPADVLQLKQQWESTGAGMVIPSPSRMRVGRWQMRDPTAPWADKRTRHAAAQFIDRDSLANEIFGGLAIVPDIMMPADDPAVRLANQRGLPSLKLDPGSGHRLLADAGFARGSDGVYRNAAGEPFMLEIGAQSDINSNLQVIQTVADNWKQNGIQASTVIIPGNLDWREVGANMKGVYIGGSTPGYSAYEILLSNQVASPANRWRSPNMGGVTIPTFDDLYNRVLGTIDANQRNQVAADMVVYALEGMLYLPLHSDDDTSVVAKSVSGVTTVTSAQRVATWNIHAWNMD
jgi:peptide/nickel transport system substrate-binding protein